jgi:uroporphyrinogen decarboxylase
MEVFGKVHPCHRNYHQWGQMREAERELHRRDMAQLYVDTAERFEHNAIFIHGAADGHEGQMRIAEHIRAISGDRFAIMVHGDPTYGIPNGAGLQDFSYRLADDPQGALDEAQRRVDDALAWGAKYREHGAIDIMALCSDYCFNSGPFLSPRQTRKFVIPYLKQVVAGYREQGLYVIKHTDGNIMPILDDLVDCNPHALHSLDPQGGVDMATVKRLVGGKVCLIGNVDCGKMDTGTEAEVEASARKALSEGMPGYGYIFSSSNCVYTGMRLERYELIRRIWQEMGNYL